MNMSESDLSKALLNVDATNLAGVPDDRQLTWRILEYDRRTMRRLTILTLIIWVMAIVSIGFVLIAFGFLFPLQAKLRNEAERDIPAQNRNALQQVAQQTFQMLVVGIAYSVGILALAALSTVRLTFASRRATLRQVNSSLVEISQQLKDLRAAMAKPPAESLKPPPVSG
jgi:hypothetical protein